ncbi:MAG: hypothetical protein AAF734_03165 [Bacteroidota bacterium]
MKTINWLISSLVIMVNVYFLPVTFSILQSAGGGFGYGFLILPISVSINLLVITAVMTFKAKFKDSLGLLIINGLGLFWALFWLWILYFPN